jgi:hypothetical protein
MVLACHYGTAEGARKGSSIWFSPSVESDSRVSFDIKLFQTPHDMVLRRELKKVVVYLVFTTS